MGGRRAPGAGDKLLKLLASPGDVVEVPISAEDMLGPPSPEERALAATEPVFLDAEEEYEAWHADALKGCDLLAKNETWVCPSAMERLPGLLPRYPVDDALSAANHLLFALSSALNQTRTVLGSALATLARSDRSVGLHLVAGLPPRTHL